MPFDPKGAVPARKAVGRRPPPSILFHIDVGLNICGQQLAQILPQPVIL